MRKLTVTLSAKAMKELFCGRDIIVSNVFVDFGNVVFDVFGIGPELSNELSHPPERLCRSLAELREVVNGDPRKNTVCNTVSGECAERAPRQNVAG